MIICALLVCSTCIYIIIYISDSSETVTFRCVIGFAPAGPAPDDTSTNPASHGAHCAAELSFGGAAHKVCSTCAAG